MLVPDEVRKCVVFVGVLISEDKFFVGGTAFLLTRTIADGQGHLFYAVTAGHVITGIQSMGKRLGIPVDKVYLRVNELDGEAKWAATNMTDWHFHPDGPAVDVAVLRIGANFRVLDHKVLPIEGLATADIMSKYQIGVGDEVFITGLFRHHYGGKKNLPIVRVGNIAAMPEEKVETGLGPAEAYLVEARSIGGLSGSPVFVNLGLMRWIDGRIVHAAGPSNFWLLGLTHGHFDTPGLQIDQVVDDALGGDNVNVGIAIVVPAQKILDVIQQPAIADLEKTYDEGLRKELGLPPPQSNVADDEPDIDKGSDPV